jgi:hypothetical protein
MSRKNIAVVALGVIGLTLIVSFQNFENIDCGRYFGREATLCRAMLGQKPTGAPIVPPQQVFRRLNNQGEIEIGWRRDQIQYPLTGRIEPAIERVVWLLRRNGSARQVLYNPTNWGKMPIVKEYSPSEFELFRVFGSLGFLNQIPNTGERNSEWDARIAPFSESDRMRAFEIIRRLSDNETILLYYSLWEVIPAQIGGCGSIKRLETTTPPQAMDESGLGYASFQWSIMYSIYNYRRDLHQVFDPETRSNVPGILPPEQLPQIPCLVGKSRFDIVADGVLTAISLGFPGPTWATYAVRIARNVDRFRAYRNERALRNQSENLRRTIAQALEKEILE